MFVSSEILIFGSESECAHTLHLLRGLFPGVKEWRVTSTDDSDVLRSHLVDGRPDVVIVLENGAAGMEAVYLVRRYSDRIQVFWFSDDPDFGVQSHRLDCNYFAAKPLTPEKLRRALHKCFPGMRA